MIKMTRSLFIVMTLLATALSTATLSGCLYRTDTQQGNIIEAEKLMQVERGLTQDQVQFLLGTPVISDPLHPDRWDYAYYFKDGDTGETKLERVTILFNRGLVSHIIKDGQVGGKLYQPPGREGLELELKLDPTL